MASAAEFGRIDASADAQEFGFEVSMAQTPLAFQLTSARQQAAGQLKGVSEGALRLVRTLLVACDV
jgi:hypothetical protein